MIARLLAAALVAGISPAAALQPIPARYNRPYDGRLQVTYVPYGNVVSACIDLYHRSGYNIKGPGFLPGTLGCALVANDYAWCKVIVHDASYWTMHDTMEYTVEATLQHEIAHCNGWARDHPQDTIARLPRPRPRSTVPYASPCWLNPDNCVIWEVKNAAPAEALTANVEACYDTE